MIVIPMAELLAQLDATLVGMGVLKVFLFVADVTPDLDTELADLEAGRPTWCDPQSMSGRTAAQADTPVAFSTWDDATFLNDDVSAVDIYGYCVQNEDGDILRWAERNPGAPVNVAPGQSYTVRPYYSRRNTV